MTTGLGVSGDCRQRLVQFVGQLGHHFPDGAQPANVGQFRLMLQGLLFRPTPLSHLGAQPGVGFGQLGSPLPDPLFQIVVSPAERVLGSGQLLLLSQALLRLFDHRREQGQHEVDEGVEGPHLVLEAEVDHLVF